MLPAAAPAAGAAGTDPVQAVLAGVVQQIPGAMVIDLGGGSGTRAVPLAVLGCRVVVVDSSIDALAILARRAADAGVAAQIDGVQADADKLSTVVSPGQADLVLCHHLLEELEDPAEAVEAVMAALRPGGMVSVLTAGRPAAVLAQALAGRPGPALAMLTSDDGRSGPADPLRRRFDLPGLCQLLTSAGLEIALTAGVGVLPTPGDGSEDRRALERALARDPVLKALGADLHVLGRRPG